MANSTADFVDMTTPASSEILFEEYNRRPKEYNRIFNEFKSMRNFETDSQLVGFSAAPEMPEGTAVNFEDALQGYDVVTVEEEHGGHSVTDDQLKRAKDAIKHAFDLS